MVTAWEISNRQFKRKPFGYDMDSVDDFLDEIVVSLSNLEDENTQSASLISKLKKKLAYYDDLRETLNQSIIIAQNASTEMKHQAQEEVASMKKQAEYEAERIVAKANEQAGLLKTDTELRAEKLRSDTLEHAEKVNKRVEETERQWEIFRTNYRNLLEMQIEQMMQEDNFSELKENYSFDYSAEFQPISEDSVKVVPPKGTRTNFDKNVFKKVEEFSTNLNVFEQENVAE
ncbi:MAG: DivIVA domain-containing protein [Lactobacillales bacterium]|jgi:cell division initiation protein|nr:DivIVA domain-containing protein [Lactobacillales bacterium]